LEFLVEIEIAPLPPGRRAEQLAAEAARGRELLDNGTIERIWRIPGRTANAGIWSAADPTQLHAALASLPLFEWIDARVTALAEHPLERP
jgi:muconolactone D-isomerase